MLAISGSKIGSTNTGKDNSHLDASSNDTHDIYNLSAKSKSECCFECGELKDIQSLAKCAYYKHGEITAEQYYCNNNSLCSKKHFKNYHLN